MSELVADVRGHGPPVVLLHGQPGGRGDWTLVADQLVGDFTVISPDRPGYGETGGRARGFRANAAAVLALLDRLGAATATVVGYSWAGGIAVAVAEEAPERLSGMVLVSSIGPGEPLSRLDRVLAVPPIGASVTAAGLFVASGVLSLKPVRRAWLRRHGDGVTGDGTLDPDALIATWRSRGMWQSFVTEQRSLIDELPFLEPALATIAVPTVVVVGTADRMVPPATGRRLAATIPGADLVELEGAGHLLAHQRPRDVAAAVRRLAESGPGAAGRPGAPSSGA
jgi:3-oxoadipate enol-lactonase